MLRVLRGAELSDVLAVVVRWFGGVKLGKGGLARAYTAVTQSALRRLPVGRREPTVLLTVSIPYERVGDLKRLIHPPAVEVVAEAYGERVEMTLRVLENRISDLEESLAAAAVDIEGLASEPTAVYTRRKRTDSSGRKLS
jgi:putative IMPACT (imprinted ancient) family translation regulator